MYGISYRIVFCFTYYLNMDGQTKWPPGFADIGGQTFEWVREDKPDWVDFTLNEMKNPSGLFLVWKTFLLNSDAKKLVSEQTSLEICAGNIPSER